MNNQTDTAIKIFTDLYGLPKWLKDEKEGQDSEKMIELWDNELKDYTPEQVKVACYRVAKYKKSNTFPSLSHILAELVDEDKQENEGDECQKCLRALIKKEPPFSDLAVQRTMWRLYKFKYKDYNPDEDTDNKRLELMNKKQED